jgi:hypothetical protein
MNPQDLTGRDLDLAVARTLGLVWYAGRDSSGYRGVTCQGVTESPPLGWHRIDEPGPEWGSPWLPGYDCDGGRIPELFAEIAAHTNDGTIELIRMPGGDFYSAKCFFGGATGSTPNEALARLLLMVAGVP